MLESFNGDVNTFDYEKISPEEQQKRGILGRLKGIICDFKRPTRNGRLYSEKLWNKLFEDPIMQEKIQNRCLFGEIEHPADGREEIDPEKIAICLAEMPKKDNNGHLMGVFDILNTPCGKILKAILDYGTTVAISSRGSGDVFTNYDGVEEVDPDSYSCSCWDIVFTPGVKEARLIPVNESLQTNKLSLVESLNKLIEEANESDKIIMQETIKSLNIMNEDTNLIIEADKSDIDNNQEINKTDEINDNQSEEVKPNEDQKKDNTDQKEEESKKEEPKEIEKKTYKIIYKFPNNKHTFFFISNDCIDKDTAINAAKQEIGNEIQIETIEEIKELNISEAFGGIIPMKGYDCYFYTDKDCINIIDSATSDDIDEIQDWAWDYLQKNNYVIINNRTLGNSIKLSPEEANSIDDADLPEWFEYKFNQLIKNDTSSQSEDGDSYREADSSSTVGNTEDEVFEQLQETLTKNQNLESELMSLQEKLSVCYAKDAKQEDRINQYKDSIEKMSEQIANFKILQEQVSTLKLKVNKQSLLLNEQKQRISDNELKLNESIKNLTIANEKIKLKDKTIQDNKQLIESLQNDVNLSDKKILELSKSNKVFSSRQANLNENLNSKSSELQTTKELLEQKTSDINKLNESYNKLQEDFNLKQSEYSEKLEHSKKLVEKYKRIAQESTNRYIKSQADRIGVTPNEIKNKLSENYSFDDIDKVVDDLQSYKVNMSKLPFRTNLNENANINAKIITSKTDAISSMTGIGSNDADEIDDMLMSLAGF